MALRYFVNGGVNNNWGQTPSTNWSLTSGGAGGQTVPTNADDVFFDANSPNCTVNSAQVCKSINFTGYTNTITMTFGITISGSITFNAGLLVAGSAGLTINATGTITSNTFAWPNAFSFLGTSQIYTLADEFTILGLTTFSYVSTMTLNGSSTNKLIMSGGLTVTSTTVMTSGTADLNITGGTWQHTGAGSLVNNLFLNGNITIGTNVYYRTGTLTYTSGIVDTTTNSSTLNIGASCTLNTNGINWNNIVITAGIQTLTSDLYCQNLTASSITINGLFNVNVNGNITATGVVLGTSTIVLIGTGLWTATNASNTFRAAIIINTNGIITLPNTLYHDGNLTYIKGIVKGNNTNITFGSIIKTLINLNKLIFKSVILETGATYTMNEFFSGSPSIVTNISSNSPTNNYNITFQDNFEKIAKFVNISNCTLTKPLQLLVITNSKRNSRNSGIRYINQSPNGIAKNEPSTLTQTTYGTQMLLNDPAMN